MTPDQAKEKLREAGKTSKEWALEKGFEYHTVIAVLNGNNKGHRGAAHKVAVALGVKQEVSNV